jgi:peroxiredoxin
MVATLISHAHEISGRVVDSTGAPVTGCGVWVSQDRVAHHTVTDESGRFAVKDLVTGPVEIVAWKEGYAVGGMDARLVGMADVTISIVEPDTLSIYLIERSRGIDEAPGPPRPIEGARVASMFVNDAFHVPVEDLASSGFPSPRSDANGVLNVAYLPKGGHVSLRVSHRRYAESKVVYYPVGERRLVLQMVPGVPLGGRATNQRGEPVPRARVSVYRSGPAPLREQQESLTDSEGYYSAVVPPGEYYVIAKHPNYASAAPVPVRVQEEETGAVCDLVLTKAVRIRGRVVGDKNKALAGVIVRYLVNDSIYDESLTDNGGDFSLQVAPGEGRVHVEPPEGYICEEPAGILVRSQTDDVQLKQAIRLAPLPEITGVTVDPNGNALGNVIVASRDLDPPQWTVSDEDGQFSLRLAQAPFEGKARFRAEHVLRFLRSDFEVTVNRLRPVNLKLTEFDPNTAPCDQTKVVNQMDGMRGKPAPEWSCGKWFNVPGSEGDPGIALQDLRGRVVVLNFWAGFDTTAKGTSRLAELNTLYELLQNRDDVAFVGIHDGGNAPHEVSEFIRAFQIRYPVGVDSETITYDAYDIFAIPQTVLIDKQGVLRYYDIEGRLLELIKALRRE